ncbi:MAG: hypothetical protein IKL48_00695 [Elusimicrobiaceae bacterium]|nr:hypothetical protein [Elusimicrobiaceae bacterium]
MKRRLVNAKGLAEYIGSTEGSINTYKCQGKIPKRWIVPLGTRGVRYDLEEVDKSIEDSKLSLESIFKVQA